MISNKVKIQIDNIVLENICEGIKEKKAVLINEGGKISIQPLEKKRIVDIMRKAYLEEIEGIKYEGLIDVIKYTMHKMNSLTENEIATYLRTMEIQKEGYTKDDIILILNKRIEELKRDRRASSDDGWKSFREMKRLTDENEKLKEKLEKTENKLKRILDTIKED